MTRKASEANMEASEKGSKTKEEQAADLREKEEVAKVRGWGNSFN